MTAESVPGYPLDRCISVITPSPEPTARRDNVTPPPTDNNQTDTSTGGAVVPDTDPSDTATGGATEPDNSQTDTSGNTLPAVGTKNHYRKLYIQSYQP